MRPDLAVRVEAVERVLLARPGESLASLPWVATADRITVELEHRMVRAVADFGWCGPNASLDIFLPRECQEAQERRNLDVAMQLCNVVPYDHNNPAQVEMMTRTISRYEIVTCHYVQSVLQVAAVCRVIGQLVAGLNHLLYSLDYWDAAGDDREIEKSLALLECFWAEGYVLWGVDFDGRPQVMARPPLRRD